MNPPSALAQEQGAPSWGGDPSPLETSPSFPFRGDETYAESIPTPSKFFGIPLGDRFTPHHDVLRYCRMVAERSPRAELREYGRTAEGRPLVYLLVASESHLSRLEEIESLQRRLSDPRLAAADPDAQLDELVERLPAIAWMSYNVHGDESSPTETAMQTLYELVDGEGATPRKIRKEVVTIIDPCLNPDGRERYLQWYHSVARQPADPDPDSREHDEPWPGGRTNHYYFDLNRDWAWLSQLETQQRAPHYLRWQPLVHGDFHEMGAESTYFFFPAEEPINKNYTDHTIRWSKVFGQANATAFDKRGWLYYTAESFDLFYPGYGDSWPSLHGAIGMTYEQAGSGGAGLAYRRRNGDILTLRDRLYAHHVAGLATLESAADNREELQRSFFGFRRGAIEEDRSGRVVEYVIPPGQGYRLDSMIRLLRAQGVEVEETLEEIAADELQDYFGETQESVQLPKGTLIVPLAQPAGRLAQALLEPEAEASVARFYDVSAWSLPFAMGVDAYATQRRLEVGRQSVDGWRPTAGIVEGVARYAYLIAWDGVPAARALLALQSEGVRVRLVPERIRINGVTYRGALQIPVATNGTDLRSKLERISTEVGVTIRGVDTGLTEEGIDLGSNKVQELAPIRVAVATGPGVSSGSFGALWYLFERELGLRFSAFELSALGGLDLDKFNVLILPDGFGYSRLSSEKERLSNWVRRGGVLIGLGGGAMALSKEGVGLTPFSRKRPDPPKKDVKKERRTIQQLREERMEQQVPGHIVHVDLDPDHRLSLGLPDRVFALMRGLDSFAITGGSGDVGALLGDPAVAGFLSPENIAKLDRRLYLAEHRSGRGAVICFADDPNFRLFWRGLERLFMNALFLRATR